MKRKLSSVILFSCFLTINQTHSWHRVPNADKQTDKCRESIFDIAKEVSYSQSFFLLFNPHWMANFCVMGTHKIFMFGGDQVAFLINNKKWNFCCRLIKKICFILTSISVSIFWINFLSTLHVQFSFFFVFDFKLKFFILELQF